MALARSTARRYAEAAFEIAERDDSMEAWLAALAVAAGYADEAREVSALWPTSPGHLHWWLGKTLVALPRFCLRAIHAVLGRTDMVKYRQGRPALMNTDTD